MSLPLKGAKGILMNIEAGPDAALFEMTRAANIINETADEGAQIIWGHTISEDIGNKMRVTVIATGFSDTKERTSSTVSQRPALDKSIRTVGIRAFSLDEKDLQPGDDNDIFSGVPKATYDSPSIFRRQQQK
jgi:cell division protein FtsZ